MIRAKATVDLIRKSNVNGGGLNRYRVEVWGVDEPYDYVRHYDLDMKTDTMAAQEGIRQFVSEMEQMQNKEDK